MNAFEQLERLKQIRNQQSPQVQSYTAIAPPQLNISQYQSQYSSLAVQTPQSQFYPQYYSQYGQQSIHSSYGYPQQYWHNNRQGYSAHLSMQNQNSSSRWSHPIDPQEVNTFIQTYMPWVSIQRRKSTGYSDNISQASVMPREENLLVTNQANVQSNPCLTIEETPQYKQLLRTHPASAAAMKAEIRCPERLAIYIERAFSKCISEQEREFMKDQLERICAASKSRGDFFIKQWESMPLPCLQRESKQILVKLNLGTSFQAMNDRLVKGESNTNVPFPQSDLFNHPTFSQEVPLGKSKSQSLIQSAVIQNSASSLVKKSDFLKPQSPADIEMIKRLKRIEKFEIQQSLKAKIKPKLISQQESSSNMMQEETNGMDLNEMAKHLTVKGTCTVVEKAYFRLTSQPDPADVRPEPILKQALKMLKSKWEKKSAEYKYIDDQFRSLRQDLTIQRIQNDFCVKVYETHARISLEMADLDQFNQCQTQLKELYRQGCKGNRIEFLAYQFLYSLFCELETETPRMLKQLTTEEKNSDPIKHALKVRMALVQGNYGRFFKLYREAPNNGANLINVFIDKYRVLALRNLAIGYVATGISIDFITTSLAFDKQDQAEQFLITVGCVVDKNLKKLDCRNSIVALRKAPLKIRRCIK